MPLAEMTYEDWRAHSTELLAECEKYNLWRKRSKLRLLTDIAPRIGKLSEQFYQGCGFHYSLEQKLGALIADLAMPIHWSANWCAKIPEQRFKMLSTQVAMQLLIGQVTKAEKTVIKDGQIV